MHVFADSRGRTWALELNAEVMLAIRAQTGADLANLTEDSFRAIAADNLRLAEILKHCTRVVDAKGVAETVSLAASLSGDALGAARQAFLDELIAFFPTPRERAVIARVVQTMNAAKEMAMTMIEAQLESGEFARQIDQAMVEAIAGTPGTPSGSSPASSESTLAPSLSASST